MKRTGGGFLILCVGLLTVCSFTIADVEQLPVVAAQDTIKPLVLPQNGSEDSVESITLTVKSDIQPATNANVYKFKKQILNEENIKQMARKFGIDGIVEVPEGIERKIIRSGHKIFWMDDTTGKWGYENLESQSYINSGVDKPTIPSDREALKIAEQQLKSLGMNSAEFNQGIVTNVVQQAMPSDPETILSKDIYFYKKMNGKPLLGVSRVIVNVGHNGEVQAVKKLYKDIEDQPIKAKLKTVKKILEEVKNGKTITHFKGKAKNIEITSIDVAYWEDAGSLIDQPYLQPVFVVRGKGLDADQAEFESYIPAVEYVQE